MSSRKVIRLLCLALTGLCLVTSFAMARQGAALAAAVCILLVWLCTFKWPSACLIALALVLSVGLAAGGLRLGASPVLMLVSAILALVDWDLGIFDLGEAGNSPSQTVTLLERRHYQSMVLALGPVLMLTLAGRMMRLQIPFLGMVLLVTLVFFSLPRLSRLLSN